jgi:hypothetical protein
MVGLAFERVYAVQGERTPGRGARLLAGGVALLGLALGYNLWVWTQVVWQGDETAISRAVAFIEATIPRKEAVAGHSTFVYFLQGSRRVLYTERKHPGDLRGSGVRYVVTSPRWLWSLPQDMRRYIDRNGKILASFAEHTPLISLRRVDLYVFTRRF